MNAKNQEQIQQTCPECGAPYPPPMESDSFDPEASSFEAENDQEHESGWMYKMGCAVINSVLNIPMQFLVILLKIMFDLPLMRECAECGHTWEVEE